MRALAPSLGIVAGFDLALRTYVLLPHTDLCGVVRQTRITMLPLFIHTYIHTYIYIYIYGTPPPPGLSTSFGVNMPARVFRAMGTVPMHPEY